MDYDDIQDKKEAGFELEKAKYLSGVKFNVYPKNCAFRCDEIGRASIDDLMVMMYKDDPLDYRAKSHFRAAYNSIARKLAYIDTLLAEDSENAEAQIKRIYSVTFEDCLVKSFRKDGDFVDEAVTHIICGTAQKYFE
jgi:hypothetical protein